MTNKYTGEVALTIGDKSGNLVFKWAELAAVRTQYPDVKDFRLGALMLTNPEHLAGILAIGFSRLNSEITKDFIMEVSPPILSMASALDKAMAHSYFGPSLVEAADETNAAAAALDEKKSP